MTFSRHEILRWARMAHEECPFAIENGDRVGGDIEAGPQLHLAGAIDGGDNVEGVDDVAFTGDCHR